MKTPIEELISEMQELKKTKLYENSFKAIDDCINLAYAKLEMEKEQIIFAYETGKCDGSLDNNEDYWGEEYYNEKFKK